MTLSNFDLFLDLSMGQDHLIYSLNKSRNLPQLLQISGRIYYPKKKGDRIKCLNLNTRLQFWLRCCFCSAGGQTGEIEALVFI